METTKHRFDDKTDEEINLSIKNSVPYNTIKTQSNIYKQFMDFCNERKYVLTAITPVPEIAKILKDWGYNMRKKNGENYKESVIKVMWNNTAKQVQELFYKEYNIKFDPFKDIEFKEARNARNSKRKELQANPDKRKLSSSILSPDNYVSMIKVCNEHTPDGLQKKFYIIAAHELAWRGGEGVQCLTTFFKEELQMDGTLSNRIEYNPIFSKNAQGGSKKCADSKWLTFNKNEDICPIRLYRKLMEKRTNITKTDRLFLTTHPCWESSGMWYKNMPIGRVF
jgi:hypothetical protein